MYQTVQEAMIHLAFRQSMLTLILQRGCPDELIDTVWDYIRKNAPPLMVIDKNVKPLRFSEMLVIVDNAIYQCSLVIDKHKE